MAITFHLQVVTPEREVFNGPAEQVVLPGSEGSFGVLHDHAPLIAALNPGPLTIVDGDRTEITLAIGGGFFQVANNEALVLADSAELASEIDLERARESEQRALRRLQGEMGEEFHLQRDRAESALNRARARLLVARNRRS